MFLEGEKRIQKRKYIYYRDYYITENQMLRSTLYQVCSIIKKKYIYNIKKKRES